MAARESSVRSPAVAAPSWPLLQRKCACKSADESADEPELQRQRMGGEGGRQAPASVHQALSGTGRPLEAGVRRFFESRFQHDFSGVRVHTGGTAEQSAREVSAAAYTVGQRIVFGAGRYAPGTADGQRLLAHELTHTVQQGAAMAPPSTALRIGEVDSPHERAAEAAAARLDASPASAADRALVQRDLARPPSGVPAADAVLPDEQVAAAIAFDTSRFSDVYSIATIRDVLGLARFPAVVDDDFVEAVRDWQAQRRLTQDGMIGHETTRSIFLELVAESQMRDAILLLIDSYALSQGGNLIDVRVGTGLNCCSTAAVAVADAVTFDAGAGRSICVCRTSVPRNAGAYDHFVRILLHELTHVPQHDADLDAREFDAFFAETCAGGRAPTLSDAERLGHANIAIAHFNAMPAALQTAARTANRDRLVALAAAGGHGAC